MVHHCDPERREGVNPVKKLEIKFDTYTIKARLIPALLVILPIVLAVLAWFPDEVMSWGTLWGLIGLCGGTSLLAQIGRDLGRNKEPNLFEAWGGKPTNWVLRHQDTTNRVLLAHRHKKLQNLLPDLKIPTLEEEQTDPETADEVYEACTTFLREKTRDQKKFPLVFEELCNYGFRRNLWGMKPLGITASSIGTLSVIVLIFVHLSVKKLLIPPFAIVCGIINLLFMLTWIFWLTPDWVKITAEAYANQLLASCEDLE
jgi:hypothetical protein